MISLLIIHYAIYKALLYKKNTPTTELNEAAMRIQEIRISAEWILISFVCC